MLRPAANPGRSQKPVVCYHCGHGHDVSAHAVSASCPGCNRQIHVDDIIITGSYWGARIQTCGAVVVARRARVVTQLIRSSVGVQVLGSFDGDAHTPGSVVIGPKGCMRGSVHARMLQVSPGGTLAGGPHSVHPDQVHMLRPDRGLEAMAGRGSDQASVGMPRIGTCAQSGEGRSAISA